MIAVTTISTMELASRGAMRSHTRPPWVSDVPKSPWRAELIQLRYPLTGD